MKICIFGASSDKPDKAFFDDAFLLGELIARGGHTLIYGGGCTGLMGACAAGVKSRSGKALGIAPRYFDEDGFLCKDFGDFVFTDTMAERKAMMLELAESFIVLPGGTGTMDEFFEALTLKQLGRLPKRIVLLNTCGCYDALRALLEDMVESGFTGASALEMISFCSTPDEALRAALSPDDTGARSLEDYNK